jgi:ketosteroid isomerase-like protein
MSDTHADIVRALYEAFGRGDIAAVLAAFDPNIEWNEAENFPYADGNPYVGPNAVLEGVFQRLGAEWDAFAAVPTEVLDAGERVVALGHYTGVYKSTGRAVRAQFAHVYRLRDGKITAFQQYTDTLQFRDAVAEPIGGSTTAL